MTLHVEKVAVIPIAGDKNGQGAILITIIAGLSLSIPIFM